MEELRDGSELPIVFPEFCPINPNTSKVKLEKIEGESAWRCPQCSCGAQTLQKMIFHISKNGMNIDGFGKANLERFYELGWIKDISDIYNLDYDKIAQLDGLGQKSMENLKNSIDKAKQNPIHKMLQSLSIHHLGKRASKLIAEQISNVFELCSWNLDDFLSIKDIGPVVAQNVMEYFATEENIKVLRAMQSYGCNFSQTEEDKPLVVGVNSALKDKSILFTGTLSLMGRAEAQELASSLGARNISAVSSKLDILVVGENAGSKLAKARELGTVQILTEAEFLALAKPN
jgi:DNA ligase (NAD+)